MDGLPRDRRHYGQRNSYHDWVLTIGNATKRWRGGLLACKPVKTHPYLRFPRSIGTCLSGVSEETDWPSLSRYIVHKAID